MAVRPFTPTMFPLVNVVEEPDPTTGVIRKVGYVTQPWRRFQEGVATATAPGAVGEVLTSNGTALVWAQIVNANVASGAGIAWSKISKTGSSLAELDTRSASDLNSGTLNAARLPVLSQMVFALNTTAAIGAGVTTFLGTLGNSATETDIRMVMPISGVLRNLAVVAVAAAGAAQSFTYTVRVNGADTGITCAVSGGAATTASDATHSAVVAAGDVVTIKLVTSAGAAVTRHAMGLELATG